MIPLKLVTFAFFWEHRVSIAFSKVASFFLLKFNGWNWSSFYLIYPPSFLPSIWTNLLLSVGSIISNH